MDSKKEVEKILTILKENRALVRSEKNRAPAGKLMISKFSGTVSYYKITKTDKSRIRKQIGKNKTLVYKLAHKEYLEKLLEVYNLNINSLEKCLRSMKTEDQSALLKSLPKHYDLLKSEWLLNPDAMFDNSNIPHPTAGAEVTTMVLSTDFRTMIINSGFKASDISPQDWFAMPYRENTTHLENKRQIALNGLKTRSKSEAYILDLYTQKSIYYHYDECLSAQGNFISPDIIGIRSDGAVIIHEHVGLLSNPDYSRRHYAKLDFYRRLGFEQGRNLLLTFDDPNGNINIKLISEMIDDIYKLR